jgi:hypothetical protein
MTSVHQSLFDVPHPLQETYICKMQTHAQLEMCEYACLSKWYLTVRTRLTTVYGLSYLASSGGSLFPMCRDPILSEKLTPIERLQLVSIKGVRFPQRTITAVK